MAGEEMRQKNLRLPVRTLREIERLRPLLHCSAVSVLVQGVRVLALQNNVAEPEPDAADEAGA